MEETVKDVFTIQEGKGKEGKDKSIWIKVGSAFENKDGSMNIYLNALPVNGKLQVRERKEKED